MSGLLINLWRSDNPLFVRVKIVTPTGKRSKVGYVHKAVIIIIIIIIIVILSVNKHSL